MFSPLVSPKGPKYTTAITTCRKPLSITCRFEIPLQRLLWGSAQNEVSLLKRCPNYPNLNRKQFMSVLFLIFTQQKHLTLSEFQASLYACAIVNLAHIYSQKLGVRFYLWLLRIWMQEYLFSLFQNTIRTSYGSIYVKKNGVKKSYMLVGAYLQGLLKATELQQRHVRKKQTKGMWVMKQWIPVG